MEINPNFSPRAREDFDLIMLALEGDQKAYAKLMSRYKDTIYFTILKMVHKKDDADDLTIEAFGKAFQNLDKYSSEFAFSTWLFKIAINNCIDYMRKKRISTLSLDRPFETDKGDEMTIDVKSETMDPEETFIKGQRAKLLREVLEKLNPKYKMLIELRYFDELAYEEIAEKMEIPLGTVKAQLFRAKELLYHILRKTREKY